MRDKLWMEAAKSPVIAADLPGPLELIPPGPISYYRGDIREYSFLWGGKTLHPELKPESRWFIPVK